MAACFSGGQLFITLVVRRFKSPQRNGYSILTKVSCPAHLQISMRLYSWQHKQKEQNVFAIYITHEP